MEIRVTSPAPSTPMKRRRRSCWPARATTWCSPVPTRRRERCSATRCEFGRPLREIAPEVDQRTIELMDDMVGTVFATGRSITRPAHRVQVRARGPVVVRGRLGPDLQSRGSPTTGRCAACWPTGSTSRRRARAGRDRGRPPARAGGAAGRLAARVPAGAAGGRDRRPLPAGGGRASRQVVTGTTPSRCPTVAWPWSSETSSATGPRQPRPWGGSGRWRRSDCAAVRAWSR